MYYIIYGILYLISLLPFFILYRISDLAFFIIYYISGYRKQVVKDNLEIAFPEKSVEEKKEIAKKFYRNLTDNFIETIKMLSISEKAFAKRAVMNMGESKLLAEQGRNILFCTGHQMNWEYGNWVMSRIPGTWVGVYMKIKNKAVERLFYNLRAKHGGVMVPAQEFGTKTASIFKQQYSLGLLSDQNPGVPGSAYWLYFFNKPAPFITGPDRWAIRNDTVVVFTKQVRIKRGYYEFVPEIITKHSNKFKNSGELTLLYRDFIVKAIREQPDNYLWSHRRWKWEYNEGYKKRWIDNVPPPKG